MGFKDLVNSDLNIFLNPSDFATQATYGGNTINVIFDNEYSDVNLELGVVETRSPQVICKSSDVETITHGNTIIVNNTTYKVIGIQPDGAGLTTLILSKD